MLYENNLGPPISRHFFGGQILSPIPFASPSIVELLQFLIVVSTKPPPKQYLNLVCHGSVVNLELLMLPQFTPHGTYQHWPFVTKIIADLILPSDPTSLPSMEEVGEAGLVGTNA